MLNEAPARNGLYVLYWMQQSQRVAYNHALAYAVSRANEQRLPVIVAFGLTDRYPEANLRHYRFMLEGLQETRDALRARGIGMVVRKGDPPSVALELSRAAAIVVCDRGCLRHQRAWREEVARSARRAVIQVEADVVVPIEVVTDKAEYAARTIRPKIDQHVDTYLVALREQKPRASSLELARGLHGLALDDIDRVLARLDLDRTVPAVTHLFRGGAAEAARRLRRFVRGLKGYAGMRARPETPHVSHLAMYMHFGQISPLQIALAVQRAAAPAADRNAFLEELIVRRELAHNYVHFTKGYDRYRAVPEWARATLARHRGDERPYLYTKRQLEDARTHDPYWNAAMREMKYTGYMHNHMRMYWGKKIIEWSRTPEHAFRVALELNNRYFVDGRDPASYANVAWLFGLHDRPWKERPVFGTVRYMSAAGLERKADMDRYVEEVERRVGEAKAAGVRFAGD
jgi:deoxyribodipyrimidine photo-lyase